VPQPPVSHVTVPRVSVVVCTHNGARSLPTVLSALRRQRLAPGTEAEIVVIADHCDDDTEDVARAHGAAVFPVLGAGGLAAARNTGIERSRGEIIAFTDDDCEPEDTWLQMLVEPFGDGSVDGAGGLTVPADERGLVFGYIAARNPLTPLPATLLQSRDPVFRLRNYLRNGQGPTEQPSAGAELYSVTGANMAFTRRLLVQLGGFDARITFGGEEEDLCRRAHDRPHGARLVFEPRAVVRHHYRPGVRDVLRRSRAYGRGNARAAMNSRQVPPIVYPFPVLWLGALALLLRRPVTRSLGVALLLPLLLYTRWPVYAARRRRPSALAFAHLQMAQETATMVGEAQQWLSGREG
jgi:glycosyltransferase involved in cell wall biosynthesis